IGVVFFFFVPAEILATQKPLHALRQKKHRQKIPLLPPPQTVDVRIVSGSFNPAIPGAIVAVAIVVLVAVGFVVLVVVTNKVVERISVVRRNEVDARVRPAPIV